MLHPAIARACGAEWEQRIMADLLGNGWQRTPDNTWLHPDTGEPYNLDEAARVNYESEETS